MVMCHRDLHPENVLVDAADGELVVVDWDNLGPAEPGRELARVLFDWFVENDDADLGAIRRTHRSYVDNSGPGRIEDVSAFGMLIASRLNFLRLQVGVAVDAAAEQRHRDWAEREIEEALGILPTPRLLRAVLEVVARG
jgi:aminoglycoside phosphotransferase (APT) family kinase protein